MSARSSLLSLIIISLAFLWTACSTGVVAKPDMVAPATIDYCNITLICQKKGDTQLSTYKMGEQAPMPKLKIFTYTPMGARAQLSFDSVGDGKAVHFNGQLQLTAQSGSSYTFKPQGEVIGFEGEAANKFEATPISIIITIVPPPAI